MGKKTHRQTEMRRPTCQGPSTIYLSEEGKSIDGEGWKKRSFTEEKRAHVPRGRSTEQVSHFEARKKKLREA